MEVGVLAPRCQGSGLLSVGRLMAAGDQADGGRVVSQLDDGAGAVRSHAGRRHRSVLFKFLPFGKQKHI